MTRSITYAAVSSVLVASLLMAGTAFADQGGDGPHGQGGEGHGWSIGSMIMAGLHFGQNNDQNQGDQNENDQNQNNQNQGEHGMKPAVVGTVSAISGTTLTVTAKGRGEMDNENHMGSSTQPTAATFTVDASNATVLKGNATSSVSSVAVGDTVIVLGSISGNTVVATTIRDGVPPMGDQGGNDNGHGKDKGKHNGQQNGMPSFQGNGQPIVGGTVTAVGSTTITITNKSSVSFTVDASGAVVRKGNATSSLSSISVGDNVLVQGTINGSSVVASTIIDQSAQVIPGSTMGNGEDNGDHNASSTEGEHPNNGLGNIFRGLGGIGNFFRSLFGF